MSGPQNRAVLRIVWLISQIDLALFRQRDSAYFFLQSPLYVANQKSSRLSQICIMGDRNVGILTVSFV